MMILRDIDLGLDSERIWSPKHYDADFNFRQRYVGNYLRRRVKPINWRTESFRMLLMEGRLAAFEAQPKIQGEAALVVPVHFNQTRYDNLNPNEHHEFFLGMYTEGIEKANRDFPIPYDVLMQGIEDFRKGGYKNEWVHQRKLLKPWGLHATLAFDLDTKRFRARLLLERKGNLVADVTVLEDHPDELCFAYKVKELSLDGTSLRVLRQYGDVQYTLDLATLA